MILIVTPNPAIDRTMVVPHYSVGKVHRTYEVVIAAGGKGVNVARAAKNLGGEPICAGFLGGRSGDLMIDLMQAEDLPHLWTFIEGETRTCMIVADTASGQATVVNEDGPRVTAEDWAHLTRDVLHAAEGKSTVCFSGSVPPGTPIEAYVDMLRQLAGRRQRIWVDTSGKSLAAALQVPGIGIKVNDDEAAAILGQPIQSAADAADAAATFLQRGSAAVLITMGARGAVMVNERGRWLAVPPSITVKDAVGSGDSFLAGLVVAEANEAPDGEPLRRATAAGTANAMSVGGGAFTRAEFDAVLAQTSLTAL